MRANGTGAGTYSKVPGANTRQAAANIVGGTANRGLGANSSKPPAMGGARAGPNVRARGAGARGSSRGAGASGNAVDDGDADQIMSSAYDHVNGKKSSGAAAAN